MMTEDKIISELESEIKCAEYVDISYVNGVDVDLLSSFLELIKRQKEALDVAEVMKMREILFRGKRIDDDEGGWVEGYYASQSNYSCTNRKNIHFILRDECRDIGMGGLEYYEVDPETVGQYIGQTDKNGTKIFEWDIVKCTDDTGIENIFIIMWDSRRAMFYLDSPTFKTDFYYYFADELEVIGNIHDNPELLGELR